MSGATVSEVAIGIDLGTTNCCVAYSRNGRVEIIPSANDERTTPSYVFFEKGNAVVGKVAENNVHMYPTEVVYGKRCIIFRFV